MSEPGATFIHHWLYRLLHEPFHIGPPTPIALSSRLAGVLSRWVTAKNLLVSSIDASYEAASPFFRAAPTHELCHESMAVALTRRRSLEHRRERLKISLAATLIELS